MSTTMIAEPTTADRFAAVDVATRSAQLVEWLRSSGGSLYERTMKTVAAELIESSALAS